VTLPPSQGADGGDVSGMWKCYTQYIQLIFFLFSQNVNPGLSRRFAIEDAFNFYNYSNDELLKALE
jgi:hypothetical protein